MALPGGIRAGIACALAAQLAGCSLLLVDKAPSTVPQGVWADCDEGKLWPVVDTVVGVTQLIGAVGIATTAEDGSETDEDVARVVAPIYGLTGIAFLYSAYVGFKETNHCSQIHEDAEARGVYGPYPYGYPPQPYPPPQQPYPPPQQPYPPQ